MDKTPSQPSILTETQSSIIQDVKPWSQRAKNSFTFMPIVSVVLINHIGCVNEYIDLVGRDTANLPRSIRKGKDEALDCSCGVKYGKVHHIGCPDEKCPRCGRRILGCDCNGPVDWIRD